MFCNKRNDGKQGHKTRKIVGNIQLLLQGYRTSIYKKKNTIRMHWSSQVLQSITLYVYHIAAYYYNLFVEKSHDSLNLTLLGFVVFGA